jgi:diguanylate cyclase (GGDEF)-like protein
MGFDPRATTTEKLVVVLCLAVIAVIGLAGLATRDVALPQLLLVGPIAFFVAAITYAGTAAVSGAAGRDMREQRSSFVLTIAFALCSLLTLTSLAMFPTVPGTPQFWPTPPWAGVWVYVTLQVARVAGALAYTAVRFRFDGPALTRRFLVIVIAPALLLLIATIGWVVAGMAHVVVAPLGGLSLHTAALGSALPLLIAAVAMLTIPRSTFFDRTFALSLVALAVDCVLLAAGPRFSGAYDASHLLFALSALLVFAGAIQSLVASRARLSAVESRLATIEGESATTARRIRALWKIASDRSTDESERFAHILETATAAMRPGLPLIGVLSRLDGDMIVIDATASTIDATRSAALTATIVPGARLPFARMFLKLVHDAGTTRVWNDVDSAEWTETLAGSLGCRALIATPLTIARRTYFVTFASPQTTGDEPFDEDDIAFVEVVASFISSHFTQQMNYERIRYQIEHDALTGLENRVQFRRRIREEMASGRGFAVAFANLDGFRHVNESEGHQIGDEILVEVAAGLRSIDERNAIARTSGDEFGIVLRGAESLEAATAALEPYVALFRKPFHTGDREGEHFVSVGASIGAARYPADGRTAEDVMLRSDAALAAAKKQGGAMALVFEPRMEADFQATQLRVAELRGAIANDQLALVYQPTFDLATRAVVGAEALVRWDHPERGRISPADFVPFAERNGLIAPLTRWVLDRLVRDLGQTAILPSGFRVYFNLAANLLENFTFISSFNDVLRAAPDVVRHIGVEVTETAAMQNVERSMSTIDIFRQWGLSVAIDDFGTGYSSLSYLKSLTVDVIKIDRSFVAGLPEDERDAALSEMLIRITDRFGFTILAEGIETEAQAAWLLEHGCRLGQGYLIARPAPFGDLLSRISTPSVV